MSEPVGEYQKARAVKEFYAARLAKLTTGAGVPYMVPPMSQEKSAFLKRNRMQTYIRRQHDFNCALMDQSALSVLIDSASYP